MQSIRRLACEFAVCFFSSAQASFVAIACIAIMFSPRSAASQDGFSLSADLDGAAGDQGVTSIEVSPEETVAFQIFADGVSQTQGVELRLVYDRGRVAYEGVDAGDVFPSAQVLTETGTDPPTVSLGIASMGGNASAASGLVATVRFRTRTTFTGTTIRIVEARLGRDGQQDTLKLNLAIELSRVSAGPTPDFDADGTVGFSDFVLFASQYATTAGDGRYDARFDLDSDGSVGFADFLVLAGQFGQDVTPPPAATPDRDALVALYDATEGHNWTTQTNWLTDSSIDAWHGVTVEDGRVAGLSLWRNNLTGTLPPEVGNLTNLKDLFLSGQLRGPIPVELGNLSTLERLALRSNELTGPIPAELLRLTTLTSLSLTGNQFNGPIPAEFGNLINLRTLLLTGNQLSGTIPAELGNLTNLTSLSLSYNELSGTIPSELEHLTNLQRLVLGGNHLTGTIPSELGSLTSLVELTLTGNQLSGSIPAELSKLTNLEELYLHENQLTGTIPIELSNLTNLNQLVLYWNK